MLTPCVLNLGGNAITVSQALYQQMRKLAPERLARRPHSADALKCVIDVRSSAGLEPLTFASVFPTSTHHYQLRYWLSAAGIDPDRDVRLTVVSPPHMVRALEIGDIAGYCVGEPWNSLAVNLGLGVSMISSYQLWNNAMEKVLGTTQAWAEAHPLTLQALTRAVLRACGWLDQPSGRSFAAALLARAEYVNVPRRVLAPALRGQFCRDDATPPEPQPDFLVFQRYAANFPWHSQALWYGRQMQQAGQLEATADLPAAVAQTYRTDLHRQAAASQGLPVPSVDTKPEGQHREPWFLKAASAPIRMGADDYFDGAWTPASGSGGVGPT